MNTCVPIKTNKRLGEGRGRPVMGLLLTGWGAALGSVDLTWRCVIIACRRSLSFASCDEEENSFNEHMQRIIYIQEVSASIWSEEHFNLSVPSNYLSSKYFPDAVNNSQLRTIKQLQLKVNIYGVSLPITSPGPFYLCETQRCLSCQLKLWW